MRFFTIFLLFFCLSANAQITINLTDPDYNQANPLDCGAIVPSGNPGQTSLMERLIMLQIRMKPWFCVRILYKERKYPLHLPPILVLNSTFIQVILYLFMTDRTQMLRY